MDASGRDLGPGLTLLGGVKATGLGEEEEEEEAEDVLLRLLLLLMLRVSGEIAVVVAPQVFLLEAPIEMLLVVANGGAEAPVASR